MAQRRSWVERVVAAARDLHDDPDPQAAMEAAARLAAESAAGCDTAAISLVRRNGRIETLGTTDPVGAIGDMLQFALGEGPCLDAAWDDVAVQAADLLHDPRWPAWGTRMARDYGAGSVLCVPLFTHADHVAVLSLYGADPHALDVHDGEVLRRGVSAEAATVEA